MLAANGHRVEWMVQSCHTEEQPSAREVLETRCEDVQVPPARMIATPHGCVPPCLPLLRAPPQPRLFAARFSSLPCDALPFACVAARLVWYPLSYSVHFL
jgi:hypothetical protein